jgi:hypothetical protein
MFGQKYSKIAKNSRKSPKIAKNRRKSSKIAEKRRKSPKIASITLNLGQKVNNALML